MSAPPFLPRLAQSLCLSEPLAPSKMYSRRASNLLEDDTAARRVFQEALTQMPEELRLLASLLTTAQVLPRLGSCNRSSTSSMHCQHAIVPRHFDVVQTSHCHAAGAA